MEVDRQYSTFLTSMRLGLTYGTTWEQQKQKIIIITRMLKHNFVLSLLLVLYSLILKSGTADW